MPDVPFQMLTALDLGPREWRAIARRAPWQMTRMNLNTFARHGVFDDAEATTRGGQPAARTARRSRGRGRSRTSCWPPTRQPTRAVPRQVMGALQDAMEVATANVPAIDGQVFVCPDVSGSMRSPVTGTRKGATTAVRCVDVAALVAAAVLRQNPDAEVLPFAEDVETCG